VSVIRRAIAALATVVAATFSFAVHAEVASADCLSADVYWTTSNGSYPYYVIGPDRCLLPTPWYETWHIPVSVQQNGLPPGTPNGVGANLWIPAP